MKWRVTIVRGVAYPRVTGGRRKASQERVRFLLEFSYGRNLQRPEYR
jgi:hypothetical protein